MTNRNNIENNADLKKNPFKVPAGYFENLAADLQKIPQQEPVLKTVYRKKNYTRLFAVAAMFLLVISTSWYFLAGQEKQAPTLTNDDIYTLMESGFLPNNETNLLEVYALDELEEVSYIGKNDAIYLETMQPTIGEEIYLYTDY